VLGPPTYRFVGVGVEEAQSLNSHVDSENGQKRTAGKASKRQNSLSHGTERASDERLYEQSGRCGNEKWARGKKHDVGGARCRASVCLGHAPRETSSRSKPPAAQPLVKADQVSGHSCDNFSLIHVPRSHKTMPRRLAATSATTSATNFPTDDVGLSADKPFIIYADKQTIAGYNFAQLCNAVLVTVEAKKQQLTCPACGTLGSLKFNSYADQTLRIQCTSTCSKERTPPDSQLRSKSGGTMGCQRLLPHLIQFMQSQEDELVHCTIKRKDWATDTRRDTRRDTQAFEFFVKYTREPLTTMQPKSMLESLTSNRGIRLVFVNIRGINATIRSKLETLLLNQKADFIFLTETWDTLETHSSLGTVVRKRAWRIPTTNRPQGGLEVMCHPRFYHLCSEISVPMDTLLKLRIGDAVVSLVYAPPESMKQSDFEAMMERAHGSNVVLGDFNAPLDKSAKYYDRDDCRTHTKSQRTTFMKNWIQKHSMQVVSIPEGDARTSHLDHILADSTQQFRGYKWFSRLDSHMITDGSDHGMLQIEWKANFLKPSLSANSHIPPRGIAPCLITNLGNLSLQDQQPSNMG